MRSFQRSCNFAKNKPPRTPLEKTRQFSVLDLSFFLIFVSIKLWVLQLTEPTFLNNNLKCASCSSQAELNFWQVDELFFQTPSSRRGTVQILDHCHCNHFIVKPYYYYFHYQQTLCVYTSKVLICQPLHANQASVEALRILKTGLIKCQLHG